MVSSNILFAFCSLSAQALSLSFRAAASSVSMVWIKSVDKHVIISRNVGTPHVLPNDGCNLSLHERIVVGPPRSRLRLLNRELGEKFRYHIVHVLAPAVGG